MRRRKKFAKCAITGSSALSTIWLRPGRLYEKGSAGESGALFIEIPEHIDLTGLPAFERISILLRENIISGNLVAGQALGEIELAALCDSSRNTLREALRFLHGEGLVNYHQNRGVFVRQLDKRDIATYSKLAAIWKYWR